MNSEEQTYHQVENYIQNKLGIEEREAFEKQLSVSDALREKVSLHLLANDLLIEHRLLNVSKILEEEKVKADKGTRNKWLLSVAAIVLISMIVLFSLKRSNNNEENESKIVQSNKTELNKDLTPIQETYRNRVDTAVTQKLPEKPSVSKKWDRKEIAINGNNAIEDSGLINDNIPSLNRPEKKTVLIDSNISAEGHNPCRDEKIIGHAGSRSACEGKDDGSIYIYGMQGGEAPYTFTVSDNDKNLKDASHLYAGNYSVTVSDNRKCTLIINHVNVPEKNCSVDYAFNPFMNEVWDIPVHPVPGKLMIYDNSGNIYFEKNISAGTKEQWTGNSKSGDINIGYFIFVISYEDGSQKQGSITIVR